MHHPFGLSQRRQPLEIPYPLLIGSEMTIVSAARIVNKKPLWRARRPLSCLFPFLFLRNSRETQEWNKNLTPILARPLNAINLKRFIIVGNFDPLVAAAAFQEIARKKNHPSLSMLFS